MTSPPRVVDNACQTDRLMAFLTNLTLPSAYSEFTPDRPFLQRNAYKEESYPVWNLLKELDARGELTSVQKVLTAPTMPAEELYDLEVDPHEVHNLAGSETPIHRAALARLRGELERWVEDTGDQGRSFEPPDVVAARGMTRTRPTPRAGTQPEIKTNAASPE